MIPNFLDLAKSESKSFFKCAKVGVRIRKNFLRLYKPRLYITCKDKTRNICIGWKSNLPPLGRGGSTKTEIMIQDREPSPGRAREATTWEFFFLYLFSFLLTINLKLIIVHVEIKIVNKEAATKRSTLLHAQLSPYL